MVWVPVRKIRAVDPEEAAVATPSGRPLRINDLAPASVIFPGPSKGKPGTLNQSIQTVGSVNGAEPGVGSILRGDLFSIQPRSS